MAMNKVPTLVIGVGGIGCRIAAGVSDMLSDEDRKYVGIVGLDTNVNDLKKVEAHNIKTIQTSDTRRVRDFIKEHPEYMEWFPINRFTVDRGMLDGAGQIRAISRLAALASVESNKFSPITTEIRRIRENRGDRYNQSIAVMVVGSITGGTGAGLFLQIPYYVRQIVKNEAGLENIVIRGMFLGSDITKDVQTSRINREAVKVNAYSCIKELNAFYLAQSLSGEQNNISLEYYDKSDADQESVEARELNDDYLLSIADDLFADDDEFAIDRIDADNKNVVGKGSTIPYDYLYLIEADSNAGSLGETALENIQYLVSRMVFTLLFTPVKDNALSVEDNFVLRDMETNGMARYAGAGICSLVYPKEKATEYVTLRTVEELVKSEWTILDRKFDDIVREARTRQKTDGTVKIPKKEDAFPKLFENETGNKGTLGKLFSEAFVMVDRERVPKIERFFRQLNDIVEDVLEEDDVKEAKTACSANSMELKNPEGARKEIQRLYAAVDDYYSLAKKIAQQKYGEIANRLFPPSWESMQSGIESNNTESIYNWLGNVHPLTARYFCYQAIVILKRRIRELEESTSADNINQFYEYDFDREEGGVQDAAAALAKILNTGTKRFGKSKRNKDLESLSNEFESEVGKARDNISSFLEEQIKYGVCVNLLDRFEMLADNYEVFFNSIKQMTEDNSEQIKRLEDIRLPYGQLGVYASADAFRQIAAEYLTIIDEDLPEDTKETVFKKLFKVMAADLVQRGKEQTENQKIQFAKKKREALADIFRDGVVDTIRTSVEKNGAGVVDLTVRQALEKEFQFLTSSTEDNTPDYKAKLNEYIKERISLALGIASPTISVNANALVDNAETAYIALSPECAATQAGEPSAAATKELYIDSSLDATDNSPVTVILDEEFSPYEIVCYRARYKFSVEDLVQYTPESDNAKAYRNRIRNLERAVVNSSDPDAFKTTVNPHLNRYWHEEGFIPELHAIDRKRSKKNLTKAFIYAMGMDMFSLEEKEDAHRKIETAEIDLLDINAAAIPVNDTPKAYRWFFKPGALYASKEVKSCGKSIGNGYVDLYRSLSFNGRTKAMILAAAKRLVKDIKGFNDPEELKEKFYREAFIEDLIQSKKHTGENADNDENILDIFLKMREHMPAEQWEELFEGLINVLWDVAGELFDRNEVVVNKLVRNVLKLMYYYSKAGMKERHNRECSETDPDQLIALSYGEKALKERVYILMKKDYRG